MADNEDNTEKEQMDTCKNVMEHVGDTEVKLSAHVKNVENVQKHVGARPREWFSRLEERLKEISTKDEAGSSKSIAVKDKVAMEVDMVQRERRVREMMEEREREERERGKKTILDIIVDGLKDGKFGPKLDVDNASVAAALGVFEGDPTVFDKKTFPVIDRGTGSVHRILLKLTKCSREEVKKNQNYIGKSGSNVFYHLTRKENGKLSYTKGGITIEFREVSDLYKIDVEQTKLDGAEAEQARSDIQELEKKLRPQQENTKRWSNLDDTDEKIPEKDVTYGAGGEDINTTDLNEEKEKETADNTAKNLQHGAVDKQSINFSNISDLRDLCLSSIVANSEEDLVSFEKFSEKIAKDNLALATPIIQIKNFATWQSSFEEFHVKHNIKNWEKYTEATVRIYESLEDPEKFTTVNAKVNETVLKLCGNPISAAGEAHESQTGGGPYASPNKTRDGNHGKAKESGGNSFGDRSGHELDKSPEDKIISLVSVAQFPDVRKVFSIKFSREENSQSFPHESTVHVVVDEYCTMEDFKRKVLEENQLERAAMDIRGYMHTNQQYEPQFGEITEIKGRWSEVQWDIESQFTHFSYARLINKNGFMKLVKTPPPRLIIKCNKKQQQRIKMITTSEGGIPDDPLFEDNGVDLEPKRCIDRSDVNREPTGGDTYIIGRDLIIAPTQINTFNEYVSKFKLEDRMKRDDYQKFCKTFTEADFKNMPTFDKLMRSVCFLEWTENNDAYSGTGFLLTSKTGFMFASAGHNFFRKENGRQVANTDFSAYNMMFNNPTGLSYKNKTQNEIHLNLQTDLLDQFDYTLYMRYQDEMFCKSKNNGKEIIHKREPGRRHADFMVLRFENNDAVKRYRGLSWLDCAIKEDQKPKKDESVLTFGYPGIEENGSYPLRLSFGKEGSPEDVEKEEYKKSGRKENYRDEKIVYDLDTEEGCSGSPVLGRGSEGALYTVKAIHVEKVPNTPWNAGQLIEGKQRGTKRKLEGI